MLKNLSFKQKKTFVKNVFVGLLGLEPRTTEPKSAVLPLHHRPIGDLLSFICWSTRTRT